MFHIQNFCHIRNVDSKNKFRKSWDIAYKVKFLIVVNLMAARTILVFFRYSSLSTVSTWPFWIYSNPLVMNRCVQRCPIPWKGVFFMLKTTANKIRTMIYGYATGKSGPSIGMVLLPSWQMQG